MRRVHLPAKTGEISSSSSDWRYFCVGYRFQRRALTESVGRNDTSRDGRLCRGYAARAFGTLSWLMGLLRFICPALGHLFSGSGHFRPLRGFRRRGL